MLILFSCQRESDQIHPLLIAKSADHVKQHILELKYNQEEDHFEVVPAAQARCGTQPEPP